MITMRSIKTDPPKTGQLCLLFFPIGENQQTGKSFGPIAVAYKTAGGWKMADVPSPLRGLLGHVGPAYWHELDELEIT